MNPHDKLPPVPAMSAWMRVEYCALTIQPMLSRKLYLEVRKAVFAWNTQEEERGRKPKAA